MSNVRKDISKYLFHWCKSNLNDDEADNEAFKSLLNILQSEIIHGSNSHTEHGDHVVCFSETPFIEVLNGNFKRYKPFGVAFSKKEIFSLGGRPVIYQSEEDKFETPEHMLWRHVTYNPLSSTDWRDFSWEREWRLKAEILDLNSIKAVIVVPNNKWKKNMLAHYLAFSERMNKMDIEILGAVEGCTPEIPQIPVCSLENSRKNDRK